MLHRLLIALALLLVHAPAYAQQADQVMTGEITGADHETYKQIPFDVPEGVERITVRLSYDKANRTVVDLGLFDPRRFRGWSGGTRDRFTIAASDASPGYLPGALPAGRWHVQLGVPNARKGARSPYRVEVFLDRGTVRSASAAIADGPVRAGPGWFRGDLHMHDAHSDGSCTSKAGRKVPCPLFRTVDAAARAGLDFVAVTDHNTVAHFAGLRELQPYYDDILLIPGTEVTTFGGHANAIGLDRWVDFRIGTPGVPNVAAMEKAVAEAGAILSINHPALPSGEACMGCGWIWPDTDWTGIAAVEAINANTVDTPLSGIGFWYARLNAGNRLTGIGGSDNHDPDAQAGRAPIGRPTTVVHAAELSTPAILAGIRAGRVFIDVEGTRDRMLDVTAVSGRSRAAMGETIAAGARVDVAVTIAGVAAGKAVLVANGVEVRSLPVGPEVAFRLDRKAACGWVSVKVTTESGKLLLVGNPIYVTCGKP
ncbi:phosphotransferase [Sphingomonas sp. IBVSS2]|uniref:CehA/McbA family metallohydrolase n=1 Tax=Sphingomonas sp. IBVSS2 TaxID=1985172 RepID=UPI000A2E7911|nr:CehA/McbA family metallohydrolase [Sphingomonas sp. IBVSS2]OSZ70245.1 phosphotransferase [Sphingomonas sp. IBVSS2]